MIQQEEVVDLVRRVFKYLPLFLILISCKTVLVSNLVETKYINITKDEVEIKNNKDTEFLNSNLKSKLNIEEITGGSISTTTIIGSDIWIGKLGGELLRSNLFTGDTTRFLDNNYTIKDFSIKKIIELDNKIIALQSDRVIEIFKSNEFLNITVFPVDISRATDIAVYKNRAYISTLGYGLWEFNSSNRSFLDFIPDLKYISSLLVVDEKLYIGTMNSGLFCYDLKSKRLDSRLKYPLALFNKNILDMKIKKNIMWLGTAKNGLIKWDIINNSIERIHKKESVSSIYLTDNINVVSFIGFGIYIEKNSKTMFESIDTILQTNNVTTVKTFNNKLISGNIKKGLVKQEMNY